MFERRATAARRSIWQWLVDGARRLHAYRAGRQALIEARKTRGISLPREWLTAEQKAHFEASRYFDVTGCDSGKRYRIHHGRATNVHEIDGAGQPVIGWCFIPAGDLVAGDVMLAQKIALETDERATLAVANRFVPTITARQN